MRDNGAKTVRLDAGLITRFLSAAFYALLASCLHAALLALRLIWIAPEGRGTIPPAFALLSLFDVDSLDRLRMSLRPHGCVHRSRTGFRIVSGCASLCMLLSGCATFMRPVEPAVAQQPVVKVDGLWASDPTPKSKDPFERQELPPNIESRLLRNQPPEVIAAATVNPLEAAAKVASAAPVVATTKVAAPPTITTPTEASVAPLASPESVPVATATSVDVQREQELRVLAQKATTAATERHKPVAKSTPRSESKPQPLSKNASAAQLIGMIEDAGGGSIAILQIPGSGMQRARLGDTIHLSLEGQDTSMRVGAIENGQVVLTSADNSRTVVIR